MPQNTLNPERGAHFVRACAVAMHANISKEPLLTIFHKKHAGARNNLIKHPPLRLPQQTRGMDTYFLGEHKYFPDVMFKEQK